MEDIYYTIKKNSTGLFKDKGSKFISYAYPVKSEDEVKEILKNLKKEHHNARHHCYAWRLGAEKARYRANDDGEPSSTAGKPILGQLVSYNVTNILAVVVRYFGGTLLGANGLINAYRSAAKEALENAEIIEKKVEKIFSLNFSYNLLNEVMGILKNEKLNQLEANFMEDCNILFSVRLSEAGRIEKIFSKIYGVSIEGKD